MVSISKISTMPIKTFAKPSVKNVAKVALPVASGLGVLAGASLSGMNPPFNVNPLPPGADIMNDPFLDVLKYQGEVALDSAGEMAEMMGDGLADLGHSVSQGVSNIGEYITDTIADALDYLPF